MRVAIVVPSGDTVHADFAMSLATMMVHTQSRNVQLALINPKCSLVQKGRWHGVKTALDIGFHKILFIDSDQTFPPYALTALINHKKKIVGATCRKRQPVVEYTARDWDGNPIDINGESGLIKVSSNGFPFCLIDTEVFTQIPEPWFNVVFNGNWVSEDETFCFAALEAGYDTWVDVDLSHQVGHIGTKNYI